MATDFNNHGIIKGEASSSKLGELRYSHAMSPSIPWGRKKWKPKLIRSDFEAVVVEIGRHFLPDRKEILNKTLSYS